MKRLMSMIVALFLTAAASAQPVQWSNTVKKTGPGTYEVHLTATVQSPWHIYSQYTPAGGPIPTEISFGKNPVLVLDGPVKELGSLVKKREEVFGLDVMYFNDRVDFVQTITTKAKVKTNISGTIRYMVCNDRECLPPKNIPFQLPVN